MWTDGRGPVQHHQDRSLNAHLWIAVDMARSQGLTNVFLATDNVTLVDIAPRDYPEYNWFMQQRVRV